MNSLVRYAALCGLVATLPSPTAAAQASDLAGTTWELSSIPGQSLVPGHRATVEFDAAHVRGSDGCDRYEARYSVKGSTLRLCASNVARSAACTPEVMAQAQAFSDALAEAHRYRIDNRTLHLIGAAGSVVATFSAPDKSLVGTSWRVIGFEGKKRVFTSPITGTELTVQFLPEGKISGSAGCNRYAATYSSDGERLVIGAPATTRKRCTQPEGIMEQEQQFLAALQAVATAHVESDRLELRTTTGALAVTLEKSLDQ